MSTVTTRRIKRAERLRRLASQYQRSGDWERLNRAHFLAWLLENEVRESTLQSVRQSGRKRFLRSQRHERQIPQDRADGFRQRPGMFFGSGV